MAIQPAGPHPPAPGSLEAQQSRMDLMVGYLLLTGVALSMVLIAGGLFWNYLRSGHFWLDYRLAGMNLFEFLARELRLAFSAQLGPRALVDLGIAVLMFTPYFRVLASMIFFLAVARNWKYSLFTAVVLGVLTFSLFLR